MFDAVLERQADWAAIQALSISREAFLAFFYQPPTEQKFSFLRCMEITDKVRLQTTVQPSTLFLASEKWRSLHFSTFCSFGPRGSRPIPKSSMDMSHRISAKNV
jgi:hypothetical protein